MLKKNHCTLIKKNPTINILRNASLSYKVASLDYNRAGITRFPCQRNKVVLSQHLSPPLIYAQAVLAGGITCCTAWAL